MKLPIEKSKGPWKRGRKRLFKESVFRENETRDSFDKALKKHQRAKINQVKRFKKMPILSEDIE